MCNVHQENTRKYCHFRLSSDRLLLVSIYLLSIYINKKEKYVCMCHRLCLSITPEPPGGICAKLGGVDSRVRECVL